MTETFLEKDKDKSNEEGKFISIRFPEDMTVSAESERDLPKNVERTWRVWKIIWTEDT